VINLKTPSVRVIRASDPEKELDIQTTNVDLVLWDRTRVKHKWPKFEDAPFLWLTFISWAAARRSGLIPPDTRYETWEADCLSVDASDDDDDESGVPFPERVTRAIDSGIGDRDTDEP
jgi:hypothetical protein